VDAIPFHKARPIFYIIAEALTNVRKHARAKSAQLHLRYTNKDLVIDIKDDGKGFDINEAKLSASGCAKSGLISMRQRAISLGGEFAINSAPNQGTGIHINIPLEEKIV
jgi:signal transduction histidine kinase